MSVDPKTEQYWGSLRLLPTTGPNMLRDVFPQLLEEGEVIESATIWESSRICAVNAEGQPDRMHNGVNYVLSELIAGIGEVCQLAGLTQIVSVFDARILRVLRAAGCPPQIIGKPQRIGDVMAYAGLFEPDPIRLADYRVDVGDGRFRAGAGSQGAHIRLNAANDARGTRSRRRRASRLRPPLSSRYVLTICATCLFPFT